MTLILDPKNAFWATIYIPKVSLSDGTESGKTTGTVSAFLATSGDPDALAADSTLSVACTHIGQVSPTAGQFPLGTWLINIPKSALTTALLDQWFGDTSPYLIVEDDDSMRVETKLKYKRSRKADLG
jgi:hypothetical protein